VSFRGRSFLNILDYSPDEVHTMLRVALQLKDEQRAGKAHRVLSGRTLGMIFQKNSTRTRVSFEVGMAQLGGQALFLSSNDLQLNRGETIADTARVLGRFLDGIMARTYAHADVEALARHSGIPVVNGLSDLLHPCQAIADLLTIQESKGRLAGVKMAYLGDSNNVTNSLMNAAARVGMDMMVGSPEGHQPDPAMLEAAQQAARLTGCTIQVTAEPAEAVRDADVVYTDTWTSMGQEAEHDARVAALSAYQVNTALLKHAQDDVIFMHCLPAHRGEEVTDEVMDGPHSRVFDEAENRLHAQKAILALLMS
jgi:ornithine carbamoyltransferase